MPANLNAQYYSAEERYKGAKDDRERFKALKEMLAVIPKHKGTEKLQADLKKKISRLKDEMQTGKSKGPKRLSYSIEKEGAGQVALVGPPNAGKSMLANCLAGVSLEVAEYAFTTRIFQPAMMPYEDMQIQLVDLPPLSNEYMENWVPSIIKSCDILVLVLDFGNDDLLEQIELSLEILSHHKIEIEDNKKAEEDPRITYLDSLIIANKMDLPHAQDNSSVFMEFYGDRFSLYHTSREDQASLEQLKRKIFELLDVVRIYSKRPGHDPEMDNPYVLPRGKTLLDFAQTVHKDFAQNLKFAKVWGSNKFDGQRITKDYVLTDKDVIELHL